LRTKIRRDQDIYNVGGDEVGTLEATSLDARWIDIVRRRIWRIPGQLCCFLGNSYVAMTFAKRVALPCCLYGLSSHLRHAYLGQWGRITYSRSAENQHTIGLDLVQR
jgi:hypothetical protein